MKTSDSRLLIVYNADGGFFNALSSSVHRVLSPNTYECELCPITHGLFGRNLSWKNYLQGLSIEPVSVHRDEFKKTYPEVHDFSLPAILLESGNELHVLISAEDISGIDNAMTLIGLLHDTLKEHEPE